MNHDLLYAINTIQDHKLTKQYKRKAIKLSKIE